MRASSTRRCLFEELTVGALDDAGRQRFHDEQMLAAELCLVPRAIIPPTVPALRAWMADIEDSGILQVTEGARRVLDLFLEPPREAEWRPVLRGVSRLAFGTLPPRLQEAYGVPFGPREANGRCAPRSRRSARCAPAAARSTGSSRRTTSGAFDCTGADPGGGLEQARKRVGIRLGER